MFLVPREPCCCDCGGPVTRATWTQLPLLRHGGYGEAQGREVERCSTLGCGLVREVAVRALNPRHVGPNHA